MVNVQIEPTIRRIRTNGIELSVAAFAVGALFSPVPYHFYFYYPAGLAVALAVMAAKLDATAPSDEPEVAARDEA